MIEYTLINFYHDVKTIVSTLDVSKYSSIYPIVQGGVPLAMVLSEKTKLTVTNELLKHSLVVDDIVDSGTTRERFMKNDFISIHVRDHTPKELYPTYYCNVVDDWVGYWWENKENPVRDNIVRQLQYIGEDPMRQGLLETPDRVIRSWDEIYAGYKQDPEDVFKIFDDDKIGGLVYVKNVDFFSTCEHHLLPFSGVAHIGYIPNGPVIGVSKLARLLDVYARRLQIQERLGEQITTSLMEHLKPLGAICILEAKHFCMMCRGVKKFGSIMGYSSVKGSFLDDAKARSEFIALIK